MFFGALHNIVTVLFNFMDAVNSFIRLENLHTHFSMPYSQLSNASVKVWPSLNI